MSGLSVFLGFFLGAYMLPLGAYKRSIGPSSRSSSSLPTFCNYWFLHVCISYHNPPYHM